MNNNLLLSITQDACKPPIFIIPSAGKTPLSLFELARALPSKHPVSSFMFAGIEGNSSPHTSIEEMASAYLSEIKTVQNSGPYFLGGHCFGGTVAYEMAMQLEAAGEQVALLALLESIPPLRCEITENPGSTDKPGPSTEFSPEAREVIQSAVSQIEQQLSRLPPERAEHYSQITQQHLHMVSFYRASPITAPITHFRSSVHQDKAFEDWKYFSLNNYSEKIVPGDTYSMLAAPYVNILGAELDKALQETDK